MIDFISGDKFKKISNFGIEYFATHDYWDIFSYIMRAKKDPDNIYKIVTHNSDWSVSKCLESMGLPIAELPNNIKWFSQNVDIEHGNIESIPIGLENSEWHPKLQKTQKISYFIKNKPKVSNKFCMCQFNPNTNPRRKRIYDYFSGFDWCLCKETINGVGYDEYLNDLNDCVFCICPDGNGIDTHRIWESLYLGCVPVVEECVNINFYSKLPILICENLLDIDEKYLSFAANNIMEKLYSQYDFAMLTMKYWENKIYDL